MTDVLVFLPSSGLGGCEHYAELVTRHLRMRNPEICLAVPRLPSLREWVSSIRSRQIRVLCYPPGERGADGFPDAVHQERAARTVVDSCAPDLVIAILPWPLAGTGIESVIADDQLPSVAVFQLFCRRLQLAPSLRARYLRAWEGGQVWVTVSADNRRSIAASFGVPTASITVVPNGTELMPQNEVSDHSREVARARLAIDPESWILLTIARLTDVKRVGLILEAVAMLPDNIRSRATLFVVGDGEQGDDLRTRAASLDLRDQVRFTGHVLDPHNYLLAADVFVTASCCEGLAFSTLEAMARGLPVIASSDSSHRELVRDGTDGLLFLGDAPEALAHALRRMWASPDSHRMGQSGRGRISASYSRSSMLSGLDRAIAEAMK
ncbi:glycosyltransferase family 4 protein [Nonomuraea sp. NPDC048901]|uniref:glycosyltransferase family 4 protein n=1 Tax=Nonomuraea sp. NPDC048901 TaxID=3155627 RepID=UPI0033D81494